MFYIDWKDVCMMAVAAFAVAFCLDLGFDVYAGLAGFIGICRG